MDTVARNRTEFYSMQHVVQRYQRKTTSTWQHVHVPYTRIFSSDKHFEGLNYVGINFRGLRPRVN